MRQSVKTVLAALLSVAVMAFSPRMARSEEQAEGAKAKVLVYYFQNMTRSSDYGYYSYIIPDSISTELKKSNQYEVQSFPVVLDYLEDSASDELYKKRITFLSDRGKEFNADFVIMGSYSIEARTIHIRTQIFNVHQQKIKDLKESSDELGVMLLVIIDNLSQKINTELGSGTEARIETEREATRTSPYIPLYTSLGGLNLGMNYGLTYMMGKWADIYDSTQMAIVYAGYSLKNLEPFKTNEWLKHIQINAEFNFFTTNCNEDMSGEKFFTAYGYLLDFEYDYPVLSLLSVSAQLGFGVAASRVEVMDTSGGGPMAPLITIKTLDPYASLAVAANFNIAHIQIMAGYALKGIFLKNEPFYISVIYFGAGYMF